MKSRHPLRILFLSRHLGNAGTTTHLLLLASGLRRVGCSVGIASQQGRNFHAELGDNPGQQGIQFFKIDFPTIYRPWFDNVRRSLSSTAEMLRIIHDFQPDVIHAQWRSVTPFAQFARVVKGIPFVITLHSHPKSSSGMGQLFSFWGDCAIAISKETYSDLVQRFSLPAQKVRLIHNGADSEHFRPPSLEEKRIARHSFGLTESDLVVAMVARLTPDKRHEVAIRALSSLRRKGKTIHLLLAGAPFSHEVTPESLSRMADELGASDLIHILGQTDTRRVLWASDLAILPSTTEAFPLAVIEAMMCGLVPIRTPAGGATEQIENGVNGFLFPFEDHAALANRIEELFSSPYLLHSMAAAALATARERFSLKGMIDRTLEVYQSVLTTD